MLKIRLSAFIPILLVILAVGCQSNSALEDKRSTEPPSATTSPQPVPQVTTITPSAVDESAVLRLWLPPEFDPHGKGPASLLLQERLEAFSAKMPGVRIETRLKALAGPGGLYDALVTTNAAAPLNLPDLVVLPADLLHGAALKGLLHPLDDLTIAMDDPDWYPAARQLAFLQNSQFAIPFALDVLVLVYSSDILTAPPSDWASALQLETPLAFAAADSQALFTLSQYLALDGRFSDEAGRPLLESEPLTKTLEFYQQGQEVGLLPFWLTQYIDPMQAHLALQEGRAGMAIVWSSQVLLDDTMNQVVAPLPTSDGQLFTLGTGWGWAMANPRGNHPELVTRLAEFLSDSNFISEWTQALGLLPARPSALQAWSENDQLDPITASASLLPSADLLNALGPVLQDVTVQVLKQEIDPATAAQSAAEAIGRP